jgi:hypothetical protein
MSRDISRDTRPETGRDTHRGTSRATSRGTSRDTDRDTSRDTGRDTSIGTPAETPSGGTENQQEEEQGKFPAQGTGSAENARNTASLSLTHPTRTRKTRNTTSRLMGTKDSFHQPPMFSRFVTVTLSSCPLVQHRQSDKACAAVADRDAVALQHIWQPGSASAGGQSVDSCRLTVRTS